MSALTLVATIQQPDPYYERKGPLFSLGDLRAMAALPAGTKLYTTSSTPEEAHQIEVDRDIRAVNLQLLVEKVLAAVPCIDDVADCVELRELEELARSLKQ